MGNLRHPLVLDLLRLVVYTMVVLVRASEEKDERNVALPKVPVITATVKLVGIVLGVETLVQLDFGLEGLVRPDIDVV